MALSVLIVDADSNRRDHVRTILEFMEYEVLVADSPEEVRAEAENLAAVFLGDCREDARNLDWVKRLKARHANTPLLWLGEAADSQSLAPELATEIKAVATLPLRQSMIRALLGKTRPSAGSTAPARRPLDLFRCLVGDSPGITRIRQLIEQVAITGTCVLIRGEPGTGKEVAARKLHYFSDRRSRPFVTAHCGTIPEAQLEIELFGREPGTASEPDGSKGRFELAEGGTLYLDEIGEMSLPLQARLLRVLQQRVFERAGGRQSIHADVRIVAASHRDLENSVREGRFREDLFHHLSAMTIDMPLLRQRREDIPSLIEELILRCRNERRAGVRLTRAAIDALIRYSWPGNLRELAGLVERLTLLQPNGIVDVYDLPGHFTTGIEMPEVASNTATATEIAADPASLPRLPREGLDIKEHLNQLEYTLIKQALDEAGGVVAHAAERLRLRRTTLVEKLRKYGITRGSDEASGF